MGGRGIPPLVLTGAERTWKSGPDSGTTEERGRWSLDAHDGDRHWYALHARSRHGNRVDRRPLDRWARQEWGSLMRTGEALRMQRGPFRDVRCRVVERRRVAGYD